MPLIGRVGRKRPRARLAMAFLYGLLCLGGITTLYPFWVMMAGGTTGPTDQNEARLVPRYFTELDAVTPTGEVDPQALYGKYLVDKYAGDMNHIASTRIGGDEDPETVAAYERFLMDLPNEYWEAGFRTAPNAGTSRLASLYREWLRNRFDGDIAKLNRQYVEEHVVFQTVTPPTEMLDRVNRKPLTGPKADDWAEFKRSLPAEFRLPVRETRIYQEFLRGEFKNQFDQVPAEVKGEAKSFEGLQIKPGMYADRMRKEALPPRYRDRTVESMWAERSNAELPIEAFERTTVSANSGAIRREFATRNFRYVLDYVLLHGRAIWNTAIFCVLAIGLQLIINPVAAYALSRYPMPATAKILLFLLATMAFPAEVAMIPSFLLLKDLGLLNTFAALVLPAAASGFMIFLLKGFFDSLPQELFESGQIDGASETTMLRKIALPLSRPVLGYLALLAFMGAYGAFMYAFLVAQDQRMWTIMVWIFQLQQTAPRSVVLAALTVAALPTLIVFLLAQRVIMRGIVIPGDK